MQPCDFFCLRRILGVLLFTQSLDALLELLLSKLLRPFLRNSVSKKRISQEFFRKLETPGVLDGVRHVASIGEIEQLLAPVNDAEKPRIIFLSNGDQDFESIGGLASAKGVTIYVQNLVEAKSEGVHPLPIGVEGLQWGRAGMPWNFWGTKIFRTKKDLVLIGPFGATHPSRIEIQKIAENPYVVHWNQRVSSFRYSLIASQYKYVACPRGNGKDTHRFWETLYRGSVPIVISDSWSYNLLNSGVPLIEVQSWDELGKVPLNNQGIDWEERIRQCDYLKLEYWRLLCVT